ncbi:putative ankyrin repeat protein RF_0381 [Patella vulgata]|uniref:putative ankyrin repeat protein RF_0381 n=1 Tax=Patella vulgata TaxID=6465 RepID=UPI0024A816A7|nr:putative ankyrin repeat protein RF_0381 [Patella vulgata]
MGRHSSGTERGVDVHARDEKGHTALYYCHDEMGRNLGQMLPLLESVGFDVLEDDSGEAFLNLAIGRLDLDAIDFLVKRKVNVSQINTCGESILHRLAWKESERDDLQRLFEYGIDVDQKETEEGSTALRNAVTRGNVRFVKCLINNGCDINIADNYGTTAVIKAAIEMKKITLKLLLKSGADVNYLNHNGQPAVNYLDMSKPADYKDCLKWILHFGGGKSVQFPDRAGLTLLERLVHRPFIEPIWYMITANCNFQPLLNRAPPKTLDQTFLPIAKALYESGFVSREIAKLLEEKTKEEFQEYVTNGFTLKNVCRRSIRIHLGLGITEKVQQLHIPSTVKDYLLMKSIIPVEYSNLADGVELDEDEEPKHVFIPSAQFLKYM